ncbi:MAG: fructosamine kinase family protein, partial [Bacteroidota bacterium]
MDYGPLEAFSIEFMSPLFRYIAAKLNSKILQFSSLSGGDISRVYLLETNQQSYVLKANSSSDGLAMFEAEKDGLAAIALTNTIRTPQIYEYGQFESTAYLLMEYVPSKRPDSEDFARLGHQLGQLHQTAQVQFGWSRNNFIGSLPQSNLGHPNWLHFYLKERLQPQFELAIRRNLLNTREVPSEQMLVKKGRDLFESIRPALLHGDLWGGNYLINKYGIPYLIDPAVYYGHAEVDIAMSRLFGGFAVDFYKAYHEVCPVAEGIKRRENWYQLYYLLVHLNL